jgi:tRNA(fMet)-specific endonuclease VapC
VVLYLLDTNVAVDYLTGRYPAVAEKLRSLVPEEVAISSVAVAELRYGADKSGRQAENLARLDAFLADVPTVDFDLRAAAAYGRLRALLEAAGTPIGPNDMLIAAQALAEGLVLVSSDVSEFRRVPDLQVQDWRSG